VCHLQNSIFAQLSAGGINYNHSSQCPTDVYRYMQVGTTRIPYIILSTKIEYIEYIVMDIMHVDIFNVFLK
jgi:hypothetical protein